MESASLPAERTEAQAEPDVSSHLVRMIDFFFALVLGQGLLRFEDVVKDPFSANPEVWIALVLIYYTVIRSFIAWHVSIERGHYRIASDHKLTEHCRVYIDAIIVVLYAFMLFSAEPLMNDSKSDIGSLLLAFPILFLLYVAWGLLRGVAWSGNALGLKILFCFGGLYVVLLCAYEFAPLPFGDAAANAVAMLVALLLMVVYRCVDT